MAARLIRDRVIEANDPDPGITHGTECEQVVFRGCRWAQADLSGARFTDCSFERCDLSNIKLAGTGLRNVRFIECKLLGADFDPCSDFLLAMAFRECILDMATFRSKRIPGTVFRNCRMHGTDFSGAGLRNAAFPDSDLAGAIFDRSDLEGADLRTARNFAMDPERNRLKKARFSRNDLEGLLLRYGIVVD